MIASHDIRFWLLGFLFLVWLIRAWRAIETLIQAPVIDPATQSDSNLPFVSVLIPAKNEESNIGACIDHFLALEDISCEIIVANDNSTDSTEEILKSYGSKIQYVNVPGTPEGWTGKNHALHHAVGLAKGDWFLFTDADTRHQPGSLRASLNHVLGHKIEFLTLLPRCLAHNVSEHLIQPLAMALMGLWFPIGKINNPKKPVYFGNGQYILMTKKLYEKIGGHEAVAGQFLEDFAMMEKAKRGGDKTQCAFGMKVYGTRMYDSLESLWRGWRRIYLHAFKQKPKPLLMRFFGMILFSVIPFTSFLYLGLTTAKAPGVDQNLFILLGGLLTLILATSWKAYTIVGGKRFYALLHPIAAFFMAMILLDAFWMAMTKKKTVWR